MIQMPVVVLLVIQHPSGCRVIPITDHLITPWRRLLVVSGVPNPIEQHARDLPMSW